MELVVVRLMIDFGLLVLIWLVQLVIYPGFLAYKEESLIKWHPVYTNKISYPVMPLMFVQTGLISYQLYESLDFYSIASALLCLMCWLLTFFRAVPLHHQIDKQTNVVIACQQLIQVNWYRTTAWSLLWGLSLVVFLTH